MNSAILDLLIYISDCSLSFLNSHNYENYSHLFDAIIVIIMIKIFYDSFWPIVLLGGILFFYSIK